MLSKISEYLLAIGFLGSILLFSYLTNPLGYGLYFGYLLMLWMILKRNFISINLDFNFIIILTFGLTYGLFYSFNPISGYQYVIVYSFTPPILYLVGKYIASKAISIKHLFYLLITVGFMFSITALISVALDIYKGGFAQSTRNIPMFWSDDPMNATGMGALFVFNMCIPAIFLASYNSLKIYFKIIIVLIFSLSLICVLRLGSRTQLVIVLVTFLLSLLYVLPKQTFKQNATLFTILAIGIFAVFRNVSFDLDADWLNSFAGRMEKSGSADIASGGGRTDRWIKSIENLFEKPLGWKIEEFGYSHNLWLDALRAGGIISFFLLISFSLRSILLLKSALKVNPNETNFNVLILVYFVAFFLLFMVEPILDGSFSLFATFCMFIGVISKYSTSQLKIT